MQVEVEVEESSIDWKAVTAGLRRRAAGLKGKELGGSSVEVWSSMG